MTADERQALRERVMAHTIDSTHYQDCWKNHLLCALIKVLDDNEFYIEELKKISAVWDGE